MEYDVSIENIAAIALKFADEFDGFEPSLCHKLLQIENDGTLLSKIQDEGKGCNAFGLVTATPGRKYHWRFKVIDAGDKQLNIGIIEAKKSTIKHLDSYYWGYQYGYSYHANTGELWHNGCGITTSQVNKYGSGDIIDMWLDLTQNKNEIMFQKNQPKTYLWVNNTIVFASTDYKLAIGISGNRKKTSTSFSPNWV